MEKIAGIYQIVNTSNNMRYIGSSNNILERFLSHKNLLNKFKHSNICLQNAWNKYSKDCFIFEIIEKCAEDKRLELEQKYIDNYDFKTLYNIKSKVDINAISKLWVKKKCPICDAIFNIYPSDKTIYCSRKCYHKAKENKFKVKCFVCEKTFFRFGSSIKKNVFCSQNCYKQKRGFKIKNNCLTCDKEFFIRKSVKKINHGKYCSRECYCKRNKIIKNFK
jgi:group I intron endonuclease